MYIIAELHNQYAGDLGVAEQMILQAKMGGAQAVKIQLYDAERLYGNSDRSYLSLTFEETKRLKAFADGLHIDFFASPFDDERLDWCLELDFPILKVASVTLKRFPELAERMVATGRRTLVSLGMYDWEAQPLPFDAPNAEYLYCVAKYPTLLEDVDMPDFRTSFYAGFSDHTYGTHAAKYAIARGARVLEKHFTLSPALQRTKELAHAGGMTLEDLRALQVFAEAVATMEGTARAFTPANGHAPVTHTA